MSVGAPPRAGRGRGALLVAVVVALLALMTGWSAAGVGFAPGELLRNLGSLRRIVGDSFPPDWAFWRRLLAPFLETLQIAVVGSVLGGLISLPLAILAARGVAPTPAVAWVHRQAMNLLRTMPDLFWAMLFASAVGFGPFAGALALTVFTVAVVSKLLSESAESIDFALTETVRAGGGGWSSTVRFAVLPQILPQYVSFVLYAFEINVRASTVLGLVGAGGIGMVLNTQRTTFQYQRVTLIVLAIFGVVVLLEQLSEAARRRLV